jgi:hypothetical protein
MSDVMLDAPDVHATSRETRASMLADLRPLALSEPDGLRGNLDYHDGAMRLWAR